MKKEFYKEYFLLEKNYWFFTSRRKIAIGILDRMLKYKEGLNVLDVGTGTGMMIETLKKYGQVTGVDKSKEAIQYCKKRGFFNIVQTSAEKMPFNENCFDIICAMDLLEHINNDREVLKEFYRILKPEGLIFVTVPAYKFLWTLHDEINLHKRRYTAFELRSTVESSGFIVKKLTYFNSFLFPFVAPIKILRRYLGKKGDSSTKSDFIQVPWLLNKILEAIFSSEVYLLQVLNFPYGVSLMCVANKPLI